MRISDWSSDVCSSDLARGRDFHHDLARSSFWTRRFSDPKHLRSAKPSDFHSPHYISPFRRWSACVRKAVQQWLCLGSVAPCHVHDMRDGHVRNFRLMINLNGRSDFGKAKRQPVKRFFRRRQRLIHRKLIQMIKRLVDARGKEIVKELQIFHARGLTLNIRSEKSREGKECVSTCRT